MRRPKSAESIVTARCEDKAEAGGTVFSYRKKHSNHDQKIVFELIEAPVAKFPKEIANIRKHVFPPRFAASLPPLFRYRGWIITANQNRRIIGCALCDYMEGEDFVLLEEVAVLPECQSRQIGTELVHRSAIHAQEMKFTSIWSTPLIGEDEERRVKWMVRIGLPSAIGVGHLIGEVIQKCADELIDLHRRT